MSADELLKRLLENFCVSSGNGLEWAWVDGVTIRGREGDDFELALLPYLNEATALELLKAHNEAG